MLTKTGCLFRIIQAVSLPAVYSAFAIRYVLRTKLLAVKHHTVTEQDKIQSATLTTANYFRLIS